MVSARRIDWAVAVVAEFEGILEGSHHAEAEEIDFDDAEVCAVVLVPLGDDAAGHGGGFEGDDAAEFSLADDHAAAVLAEVSGEAMDLGVEGEGGGESGVICGDAGFEDLFFEFEGVGEVAVAREAAEAVEAIGREIEGGSEGAHGAAAAEGDDIGGHGGSVGTPAAVDFLNDFLAAFARGEVEVDIRP